MGIFACVSQDRRRAIAIVAMTLALAGCPDAPLHIPCMTLGGSSDLVQQAQAMRLEIYSESAHCDGQSVSDGVMVDQRLFMAGQPITLDVLPGHHAVVIETYSDDGGNVLTGRGCREFDFQAGAQVCLDLEIGPASNPDLGDDMPTCAGASCPCTTVPDDCPQGQYCATNGLCAPGCKLDTDCSNGGGADGGTADAGSKGVGRCDLNTHQCVDCLSSLDCPNNWICSGNRCLQGCDLSMGVGCPIGLTCCNKLCVDTTSDGQNCGMCGKPCGATGLCCKSSCVNPQTDSSNCGACGRACSGSHAAALSCTGGLCTSTCAAGFGNCGAPAAPAADDGCETNLTTSPGNCGACGRACSSTNVASAACAAGLCTSTCVAGFGNCATPAAPAADDGCETNLDNSTANCGACGRACSSTHTSSVACTGGLCTSTCAAGYGNCAQPVAPAVDDGCEVNTTTDVANCGACGRACSSSHVSAQSCVGSVCKSTCASGYGNCAQPVAPAADDGCETILNTDINNCGACGRACSGVHVATQACAGGLCNSTCVSGYGNCTQPAAPSADDGCEDNTATDVNNCGMCTNKCTVPPNSTTAACSASMCGVGMCSSNFQNCDGQAANGCECAGTGCCGASCQVKHDNGEGENFYDCAPYKTFNQTQAMEACAAYTGNASQCHALTCMSGSAKGELSVCSDTSPLACACWAYDDSGQTMMKGTPGHVISSGKSGFSNCWCVFNTDPQWDP
jgi:hypothetical protein